MAQQLGSMGSSVPDDSLFVEKPKVPTWDELTARVMATSKGQQMEENKRLWEQGAGPPHTDAKLRLFGTTGEPRLTLYRDTAAWCPYCQKVWMMLEEKQIPYRVEKINMRSYGEKPAWYLSLVPSGLLPAIKLDGKLITESLVIMQTFEFEYPEHKPMLPPGDSPDFQQARRMLALERQLFGAWCQLVFRSGGGTGSQARSQFEAALDEVDRALGASPGPWFLEWSQNRGPSLVDLTYVPHLERMAASTAYWKGLKIRGGRWRNIDRWFDALEELPSYVATKSDFYTHVKDIPPQYGDGYSVPEAKEFASIIDGKDGSWSYPLAPLDKLRGGLEPVSQANDPGDEAARHEAAYKLITYHGPVTKFACRGAGKSSGWNLGFGRAPLADPNATPSEECFADMDVCLRYVAQALLSGQPDSLAADWRSSQRQDEGGTLQQKRAAILSCCRYLQERVGVPRDMSYPAARQFRAALDWAASSV